MTDRRTLLAGAVAMLLIAGCTTAPEAPADPAALRDHLMRLELQSWQDMGKRDVAALRDFLADDVVLVFGDATRFDKAAFLAIIPGFTLHSLRVVQGPDLLVTSSNVATLLYTVTYRSALGSDPATTVTVAASSTYVRRNGRWLSVHYQETPARQAG
ncbi:MAG: nuclear transport factor 2 family protein [Alphaproteobacteria bacterium]